MIGPLYGTIGALGVTWAKLVQSGSTLLNGLISYWPLDETSGTRYDAVGDNALTDDNTVGADGGVSGVAASFVAASSESLASVTADPVPGTGDFTVSLWFKANSLPINGHTLVHAGTFGSPIDTGPFSMLVDGTQVVFLVWDSVDESVIGPGTIGIVSLAIDQWYHAIGWYTESDQMVHLSVNGVEIDPVPLSIGPRGGNAGLIVGGETAYYYDGLIDEVAIWSRALTADERVELYGTGAGKFYPFN